MKNDQNPKQLLLDLPVHETFAQEDFLPSLSNQDAVKYIDRWPNWGHGQNNFHCLIIYGDKGCGKTHLSHVWQRISNARYLTLDELTHKNTKDGNFIYIIEDIDDFIDDATSQESLLHLYNWTREQGGYLLFTAKSHPKNWSITLADLSSRLLSCHAVKIKSPDDDLLRAIIIKQFSDRQINISKEVLHYLLPRAERSFDAIQKMVHDIDQLSLVEKKKITIAIVKRVIEGNI